MTRRGSRDAVVIIFWRDIPAQVTAGRGSDAEKVLLDARFQHAIDRAAIVAGKTDTQSYVAEWRRTTEPISSDRTSDQAPDPATVANRLASQLEAEFSEERLELLVKNGGSEHG